MENKDKTIPVVLEGQFQRTPQGKFQFSPGEAVGKIIDKIPYDKFKDSYEGIVTNISEIIFEQAKNGKMSVDQVTITLSITGDAGTANVGISATAGIEVVLTPKKDQIK